GTREEGVRKGKGAAGRKGGKDKKTPPQEKVGRQSPSCGCVTLAFVGKRKFDTLIAANRLISSVTAIVARRATTMAFVALADVLASYGRQEDTTQRTRPSDSQSTAGLGSHRRCCCAAPRVGGAGDRLQPGSPGNRRSRKKRRATLGPARRHSGAQGCRSTSGGHLLARRRMGVPSSPFDLTKL